MSGSAGGGFASGSDGTVVIYHIDDEETPYRIRLPISSDRVTLLDFKNSLSRPNFKFFFKSEDPDFGIVKEEIKDDASRLPLFNGRVESWLVTADGSAHSDSTGSHAATADIRHAQGHHMRYAVGGRAPAVGDSRPPSFHGGGRVAAANRADSDCTSETESTISGLPKFPRVTRLDRRQLRAEYYERARPARMSHRMMRAGGVIQEGSIMTSEVDSTSFVDSEDDRASRISASTDITSVSRQYLRRRRKRRKPRQAMSRTSSVSTITESSMSVNIITVTLNLDKVSFLGISIVGHCDHVAGDGGIYVSSIMPGGAVALDGRIEAGDMVLQVNDHPFENLTNDEAVSILKEAARGPGMIKLVVAKSWDSEPRNYFTVPRSGNRAEPVCPIDPVAWIAHTDALRRQELAYGGMGPMINAGDYMRPASANTVGSNGSFTSSVPENDRNFEEGKLDVQRHDIGTIVRAMARPDSGLDVQDRLWLKITIRNAFLGSSVITWLQTNVIGLEERRTARRYASTILRSGYIKQTMNKITFSEKCYYVFNDITAEFAAMRLGGSASGGGGGSTSSGRQLDHELPGTAGSQSDHDTIGPLPPPPAMKSSPWTSSSDVASTPPPSYMHVVGNVPGPGGSVLPAYSAPTASMASAYAPVPLAPYSYEGGSFSALHSAAVVLARSEANSAGSGGSGTSSGSENTKKHPKLALGGGAVGVGSGGLTKESLATGVASMGVASKQQLLAVGTKPARALGDVQPDLAGSRASFRNAMDNPCEFSEFFVDVIM